MALDWKSIGQVDFNKFFNECKDLKIILSDNDREVLVTLFKKNRFIMYENALKHLVPVLTKN